MMCEQQGWQRLHHSAPAGQPKALGVAWRFVETTPASKLKAVDLGSWPSRAPRIWGPIHPPHSCGLAHTGLPIAFLPDGENGGLVQHKQLGGRSPWQRAGASEQSVSIHAPGHSHERSLDTTFRGGTTSSSASAAASRAPVLGRTLKSRKKSRGPAECQKRQLIQRKPHIGSGTLPKLEPRCCHHSTPAPHPSTLLRTPVTTNHGAPAQRKNRSLHGTPKNLRLGGLHGGRS